jgi:hypothetical protein
VAVLTLGMLTGASAIKAKRLGPKEVGPVVANGVRYKVPHFGAFHDKPQNGGYVQAWDVKTGKLIWDRMVYRVRYEVNREKDVQDDFITRIKVRRGHLLVKTERSEEFDMDLASGQVRALTPLGSHIEISTQAKTSGGV